MTTPTDDTYFDLTEKTAAAAFGALWFFQSGTGLGTYLALKKHLEEKSGNWARVAS